MDKIGLVTITYNSADVLQLFLDCVWRQTHNNLVLYVVLSFRDVIIRLASKFKAFYIAQSLTGYRVGSGNIFKDLDNTLKEFLYLLDKNMKDLPNLSISFKNQCYSNVYYNFAKIYAKKNNMRLAKKYFFMSLKLSFFKRKSIKIFFGILLIYLMPHKLNSYFKNINNY